MRQQQKRLQYRPTATTRFSFSRRHWRRQEPTGSRFVRAATAAFSRCCFVSPSENHHHKRRLNDERHIKRWPFLSFLRLYSSFLNVVEEKGIKSCRGIETEGGKEAERWSLDTFPSFVRSFFFFFFFFPSVLLLPDSSRHINMRRTLAPASLYKMLRQRYIEIHVHYILSYPSSSSSSSHQPTNQPPPPAVVFFWVEKNQLTWLLVWYDRRGSCFSSRDSREGKEGRRRRRKTRCVIYYPRFGQGGSRSESNPPLFFPFGMEEEEEEEEKDS